jgi:hypothetical protein
MIEDYYDEKIKRNKEIIEKVESGISLTQLAEEYGISKQRIHQIHERGKPLNKHLMKMADWCRMTNTLRSTAMSNYRCGKLKGKKIGGRYYVDKDQR